MHLRQNQNNQKAAQVIDFWSLRKKNLQVVCSYDNNRLTFYPIYQGTVLSILSFFQFIETNLVNDDIFEKFSIEQVPKNFQPYTHEKTLKAILRIILDRIDSPLALVELINSYPIVPFIIESYSRMICINFINNNPQIELFGNQIEILQNYSLQIRGNLLKILANSMNTQITLDFNKVTQIYGDDKNDRKIYIKYTQTDIQAELLQKKVKAVPNFSKIQNSGFKILRQNSQRDNDITESNNDVNLLKTSLNLEMIKCDKCKQIKIKCVCSKKVFHSPSPYHTPKSATKYQNSLNLNFSLDSKEHCKCNKLICVCRK